MIERLIRAMVAGVSTGLALASGIIFGSGPVKTEVPNTQKPNILFILTDDQGWTSLQSYGNTYVPTPHLDRLADHGMRLTNAYVMPQCTPTRAAFLTGQHTARNRMWHVIGWYGSPWARVTEPMFREQLDPAQCRLPHRLRDAGYRTGMAGKWHLTNSDDGFYTYLRQTAGDKFGFDDVAPPGQGSQNEGDKWVDHLTDCVCEFIDDNRDRPWFYYLAHHTLHNRVSAPQELVQKYRDSGAPELGLQNATYLAAIEHLDNSVGRIMEKLEALQLTDNTIVVFLSDNGGIKNQYNLPEWDGAPLDGSRPLSLKEQQFDNAPLREGKGSVYEGGIRVPCIVRWPAVIQPGSVNATPIHVVDWFPTLCAAAGIESDLSTDGVDLKPVFQGNPIPERALLWYLPLYDLRWASTPSAAIRRGDWKLIEYFGDWYDAQQNYHAGRHTELYNLRQDIGETTDLAAKFPEQTERLRTELLQWIKSIPAEVPATNPHFDPSRALQETKEKQPWNR
ncbi:MAG: sulfatase [Planctomycetales bacterium]|nr:sulfatase [Planctomycetales bacterium]